MLDGGDDERLRRPDTKERRTNVLLLKPCLPPKYLLPVDYPSFKLCLLRWRGGGSPRWLLMWVREVGHVEQRQGRAVERLK